MISITDFTSYAEVRSTVGMSEETLPDSILSLDIYANTLELALDEVTISDASLNPIKEKFAGLDPDSDSTPYNLTRVFSTYVVALEVATSLSMRAPKTLSDSKATLGRFSPEATWQDVIAKIEGRLSDVLKKLEGFGVSEVSVADRLITAVKPTYDPVLG